MEVKNCSDGKKWSFFYDECRTGNLVLELTSEESIVPYCIGYDGDDVGVADGVGVMGQSEVLAYYCGGVDIWGNCYMYGVDYCPLDLALRMAMYDGASVIVIRGGGGVPGWWRCWSCVYEIKRDDCGDSSDGGGDGVVGHD